MLKICWLIICISICAFCCDGQILIEQYTRLQKERERVEDKGEVLVVLKPRKSVLKIKYGSSIKDSTEFITTLDIDTIFYHKESNNLLEVVINTKGNNNIKLQYLLNKENCKFMESWQDMFHTIYSGKGVKIKIRNKLFLKRYLENG